MQIDGQLINMKIEFVWPVLGCTFLNKASKYYLEFFAIPGINLNDFDFNSLKLVASQVVGI